jgi:EAL domain-containing protein (putative c-di-GMP-specific phosphodiesterase class I)
MAGIGFIKPLTSGSQDAALVFAMISMAKGLGLESVVEGVETEEQAQILSTMNCTYAQAICIASPCRQKNSERFYWLKRLNEVII